MSPDPQQPSITIQEQGSPAPSAQYASFPQELKARKQWCLFKLVPDKDGKPDPKRPGKIKHDKPPFQPLNRKYGLDSTNRDHCSSFEKAVEAAASDPSFAGIGFVFFEGILGVDFDVCFDTDGTPKAEVLELLKGLPRTYTELSPNGDGLHLFWFCKAKGPVKHGFAEAYTEGRYFTVTGREYKPLSAPMSELTEEQAQELFRRIRSLKVEKKSKPAILDARVGRSQTDARFKLLFEGKSEEAGYPSANEADLAFARELYRKFPDLIIVDAMFRGSGRMRDKWDEQRGEKTYGQLTLSKLLEPSATIAEYKMQGSTLREIKATPIVWIHKGFIPLGMLVNVFAPKGTGKTKYCDWITVCVSKGKDWPNNKNTRGPRRVIRLNIEDNDTLILKPNLCAAGADMDTVIIVTRQMLVSCGLDLPHEEPIDFSKLEHRVALRKFIEELGDVDIVIIEPLTNYKGRARSNSDDDMRPVYQGLVNDVITPTGVTIITVNHCNKRRDVDVLDKALGAGSGPNVARMNFYLDVDPSNKDVRLVSDAGSNIPSGGQSLSFGLTRHEPFQLDGETMTDICTWKFVAMVDTTAQETHEARTSDNKRQENGIKEWLSEYLKGKTEVSTKEVKLEAQRENPLWPWNTVDQTFRRMKGISKKDGKYALWSLPGMEQLSLGTGKHDTQEPGGME